MTTYLLDTHALLWWLSDPGRVSRRVRDLISDPSSTLLWSAASSWEVSVKYSIGKLSLPEPPDRFLPPLLSRQAIDALPIFDRHIWRVATLPFHHRDPFDRILIAQAEVESLPVLTADPCFARYGLTIVW